MDAGPLPSALPDGPRPRVALVLQGGGALGAYQAGAYEAMHEAGIEPDWVAGVSIGGINAALIAGAPPGLRLARLRAFWERVTSRPVWTPPPSAGDAARKAADSWSEWLTTAFGQPGFFAPNAPNPWLSPRGSPTATAFYDTAPLRETLSGLVDFELLNDGDVRMACGAVNVATGNFRYFDTRDPAERVRIGPEHILASGALPPAFPMTRIDTDWYWDGGLVSNTPLQHVLDGLDGIDTLVFQVDLFGARGALPRDMPEVLARQKDIQFSSRTRMVTDMYRRDFRRDAILAGLFARIGDADLSEAERAEKRRVARQPAVTILELIYQQAAYEGQAKDYDFGAAAMREHWEAGLRDARATLARPGWLRVNPGAGGIETHDVHAPAG